MSSPLILISPVPSPITFTVALDLFRRALNVVNGRFDSSRINFKRKSLFILQNNTDYSQFILPQGFFEFQFAQLVDVETA